MKNIFRHITHLFALLLLLHVFTINVQAQDMDDNDDILDGHPEAAFFSQNTDFNPRIAEVVEEFVKISKHQLDRNHHQSKKARIFTHITIDIIKAGTAMTQHCMLSNTNHYPARNTRYYYLYFKEINPPPPKGC